MSRRKPGDYRLFFKLAVDFPEHVKTVGLSDRAFRNLIELWCYCARNLTDGSVPKAQAKRIATPKSLRELVEVGYAVERAESFEMLDYLEHQMSAAQVAQLRKDRQEAGSRGGTAKATGVASATASAVANGKQSPSKSLADKDKEEEVTTTVVTLGGATSASKGSTPRAARGTRLDPHWWPDSDLKDWVLRECPNVTATVATQNFVDYWVAKSGKDATKLDWPATYRRWMREEQQKAGRTSSRRSTTDERVGDGLSLANRLAAQEAEQQRPQIGA